MSLTPEEQQQVKRGYEQSERSRDLLEELRNCGHDHDISTMDLLDCLATLGFLLVKGEFL